MSQYDLTFTTGSGAALLAALESMEDALHTLHKGPSRPSYAVAGMLWLDDSSSTLLLLKQYDGTQDQVIGKINPTTNEFYTPGQLIRETHFTASNAAFALHAMTGAVEIDLVGGHGAGGGASTTSATTACAGSGGNAGELARTGRIPATGVANVAVTIGAGGAGATGAAGGAGGNSTFEIGATTYTAKGGNGGAIAAESATIQGVQTGAETPTTPVGDETITPNRRGPPALSTGSSIGATQYARGGDGADAPFGRGGRGGLVRSSTSAGETGLAGVRGPGGGSAIVANASGSRPGGNGDDGEMFLREYA